MNSKSEQNHQLLGLIQGQLEGVLARLDLIHNDVAEVKSDLKIHVAKDERYYDMIHKIDGNQKKMMGLAAGIALVVGVGVEKVKQMIGWG